MQQLNMIVYLCLLGVLGVLGSSGWSPDLVPNPMADPTACGRPSVARSQVCDMDGLLSHESKDVVEGYINQNKKAQLAVLIINRMSQSYLDSNGNDIDKAGGRFARTIHDKWGVGDQTRNDGGLVFLSIQDRFAYISRGSGISRQLNSANIDGIISHMRPHLRKKDYEKALSTAVVEINLLLDGKPVDMSNSSDSTDWWFVIIFVVIVVVLAYNSWSQWNRMQQLTRGREALTRLMQEVNLAQAEASEAEHGRDDSSHQPKVFASKSCPICLEDFVSNDEASARRPKKLFCGHLFCHECLSAYLRDGTKCPICRAPVDGSIPPRPPSAPSPPPPPPPPPPRPDQHQQPPPPADPHGSSGGGGFWSWGGGAGAGGHSVGSGGGCSAASDGPFSSTSSSSGIRTNWARAPELMYRLRRMHVLYPETMNTDTMHALSSGIDSGNLQAVQRAIDQRSAAVQTIVTSIQSRNNARSSGSSGSRSRSFGGGRSSGGGGGRW